AMTADVAVVASKVGGIPEQIRHQQEGLLVPPGNSSALGEAILHLLRHPLQRMQLGVAGRRRAQSQFLFSTMVQETEAIYHTLLDRQEQRDLDRQEHDSLFAETGGL
ncbi:MAG: glycosyltransferase family 4 protein, partial [Ktedonobacteraceae bacterium]|nr:glycosyltransferase family 4 protein [Ktedonobacteraceae bacterium]